MNKLKVRFYIKGDKENRNGEVAIYGKILIGRQMSTFSTAKYISRERWEKTRQLRNILRVKSEASLKEYLDSLKLSIEESYLKLIKSSELGREQLTAKYLKEYHFGEDKKGSGMTLMKVVEYHNSYFKNQVKKGDRAKGSLEKYKRMGTVLLEFLEKKYRMDDMPFEGVDRKFVYGLDEYLRFERYHNGKKGVSNNTTVKYLRNISSMINYAISRGLIKDNPFDFYDKSLDEVDTTFLNSNELSRIENKNFNNRRLDIVRDIFLFSCYTSYAPVDVMNLRRDNYTLDEDMDEWLKTKRQKTKTQTNVYVIPQLKRIIEKYQDDPECIEENRLVPKRSNTKMNSYLKEIADVCGINKNLTWYVGRHTFATTVALANDIPMEVISQIMGHKRITQTQHYAKLSMGSIKRHMKRIKEN